MPEIKFYAELDMTDLNKIINLGDPTLVHDAATKGYVDSFEPMTMPGDMVYVNPAGTLTLVTLPGPFSGLGVVIQRVTGLTPGHTIRCEYERRSGYWWGRDALRAWHAAGADGSFTQETAYVDCTGAWASYSIDITLAAGETEVGLWCTQSWDDPAQSFFQNVIFKDLNSTVVDRLPIGDDGDVLRVASGLPAWAPSAGGGGGSGNLDGGAPDSDYGGIATLDAGGV